MNELPWMPERVREILQSTDPNALIMWDKINEIVEYVNKREDTNET